MGILKVIQNTNSTEDYLLNALNYIVYKAEVVGYGAYHVSVDNPFQQMMAVKRYFGKTSGNLLIHFVVCFDTRVDNPRLALKYAQKISHYYGNRFQTVYSIHEKPTYHKGKVQSLYHAHFILNSVSFSDGKMFSQGKGDIYEFAEYIKKVTHDYKWRIVWGDCDSDY